MRNGLCRWLRNRGVRNDRFRRCVGDDRCDGKAGGV
jgi:hypothetical protein